MACHIREVEPNVEDALRFRWHVGELDEYREYLELEYPEPSPLDMSYMSPEELVDTDTPLVLAPHFSGVIRETESDDVNYFILGQAPLGGGTTLRAILPDGANCNLGPGPEPNLMAFVGAVRERMN